MSIFSLNELSELERRILCYGDCRTSFSGVDLTKAFADSPEDVEQALRSLWIKLLILRGNRRAGSADRFHLTLEGKQFAQRLCRKQS